jgi:hypothetical protein
MTRQVRNYFVSLAVALLLGACAATSPEFDAGMRQFERGEHLLALGHWQPVAETGDADARVMVESGVLAPESSGDQIDVRHLNTVFELYPCYHLGQVVEAA